MNYIGINDFSNAFYNYNTPRIPAYTDKVSETPGTDRTVNGTDTGTSAEPSHETANLGQATVRIKNADINDLSLKFNAGDDFGYIGRDVDIENLDMQKAVSDMQKDGILRQYQYFVNSSDYI